jgi:hypothetical protein
MSDQPDSPQGPSRRPLQFGISSLMLITVAVALLFGTLQWLGVSTTTSAIVLVILIIGVALAFGLVVAISAVIDDR